ncbi:MAG: tRNA (adenosine(37)-N6)-threonylcarbamoyltransferase complex dimerization subunit type 1 TsaB [Candidatus Sumerlaeaceae bacterium]
MIVLAIECSTASGGVAIVENGTVRGSVNFSTSTLYSQRLLPSLEWLMARCGVAAGEINGLGISTGPGSFTGLRIGLSAVKGLAYAWHVPVAGVGTMEALALRAATPRQGESVRVCTLLDARQGELFAGLFEVSCPGRGTYAVQRLRAEHLPDVAHVAEWIDQRTIFAGDAVLKHSTSLDLALGERVVLASPLRMLPSAEEVGWLAWQELASGDSDDLMLLEPEYLRRSYMQR